MTKISNELAIRKKAKKDAEKIQENASLELREQSLKQYRKAFCERNAERLLSLRPNSKKSKDPFSKCEYLAPLLAQDWMHLFASFENESNNYYVYAHIDPRARIFQATKHLGGSWGGEPFYIGKGTGSRAFDLKRNQGHGTQIRQILSDGYSPEDIVKIIYSNCSERKAFEIESKLIYFFGTRYQDDRGGILLNLDIPRQPDFEGEMEKFITQKQQVHNLKHGTR